jgi:hypothetical protein
VTGIRQDAWANAHRTEAEGYKPESDRGKYLAASEHDQPAETDIFRGYVEQLAAEGNAGDRRQGK